MSIITMPTTLLIGGFGVEKVRYAITESSDQNGAQSERNFGPDRWKFSLKAADLMTLAQASDWEAMSMSLDGRVNHLAVWDPVRLAPAGTLRNTPPTLSTQVNPGDGSMVISGALTAAGVNTPTVFAGDVLQIGSGVGTSQYLKVMALSTAVSGAMTISFRNYSRYTFAVGTPVYWDRPLCYCKQTGSSIRWDYTTGAPLVGGFGLELLEAFS